MIVLLCAMATIGQSSYHNWPIGTWHVVRHLSGNRTFKLSWKIVPNHGRTRHHIEFDNGTEGYQPDTVFAWVHCSINDKPVAIPHRAYLDCGNCRGFDGTSWAVRDRSSQIEVSTKLGAHGGRSCMTWFIRNGKYYGRKSSPYMDPEQTFARVAG